MSPTATCRPVTWPGWGAQRVFHLHRLDDREQLPGGDLGAVGDLDPDHGALHRGADRVPGRLGGPLQAFGGLLAGEHQRTLAGLGRGGHGPAGCFLHAAVLAATSSYRGPLVR